MTEQGLIIGLGDWIAIGISSSALVVSLINFVFNYRRHRRLEQFKIAIQLMDKVHEGFRTQHKFYRENKFPNTGSEDERRKWYEEFAEHLGFRQFYIRSLSGLVRLNEITDPDIINECRYAVRSVLDYLDKSYIDIEKSKFSDIMNTSWPTYHTEVRALKRLWEHERISRQKVLSNKLNKALRRIEKSARTVNTRIKNKSTSDSKASE